jgi:hypothetical protein
MCGAHGVDVKFRLLTGKREGKIPLVYRWVDRTQVLQKYDGRVWIEFIWHTVGTSDGILQIQ